jgi:glycosyltransferase involved in cell wall biosynthesis
MVAIFQAKWRMHSNVEYLALSLANGGFLVDVFVHDVEMALSGRLGNVPHVRLHVTTEQMSDVARTAQASPHSSDRLRAKLEHFVPSSLWRLLRSAYAAVRIPFPHLARLLPSVATQSAARALDRRSHVALIGVEKDGLAWAGPLAERFKIPLIYFSLELYTRDHFYCADPHNRVVKAVEEHYHKKCWATIVQDGQRASVLLRDNGITRDMRLMLVPISRDGEPDGARGTYLHDRLGLPSSRTLVLVHGGISERRLSLDLARIAQGFPPDRRLVFHGFGDPTVIERIRAIDTNERVSLSLNLVPAHEEIEIVRSAHIGIAIYASDTDNERFTGFSSEKIALYLQCGLPVIAFRYPTYEHIASTRCGVLIDAVHEVPAAVDRIVSEYAEFSANALRCFDEHYRADKNFAKIVSALRELTDPSDNAQPSPVYHLHPPGR